MVTISHTLAKSIHTNELQEYFFLQKHANLNRKTLSPDEACMFLNFVAQFSWSTGDMSVPSHIAFYSFVFFFVFFSPCSLYLSSVFNSHEVAADAAFCVSGARAPVDRNPPPPFVV